MVSTTSGAKGATKTGSRSAAAGSRASSMAQATTPDAQPTSETANVPAAAKKRASQSWTPGEARQILSQSAINAHAAGLDVRVYQTTRGSVVIEVMAHRIVDGALVPAEDQN